MYKILILFILAGCLNQNQNIPEKFISFEYKKPMFFYYSGEIKVVTYLDDNISLQYFNNYSLVYMNNNSCILIDKYIGCKNDSRFKELSLIDLDKIRNDEITYLKTAYLISKNITVYNADLFLEFEFMHKIKKINYTNLTVLSLDYNLTGLDLEKLVNLKADIKDITRIKNINRQYWYKGKDLILVNETIIYNDNQTINRFELKGNIDPISINPSEEDYEMLNTVAILLGTNVDRRIAAVDNKVPLLCKFDLNPEVCIDFYISKTGDNSSLRYLE